MNLYHREVFWKKEFDEQANNLVQGDVRLSKHVLEKIGNTLDLDSVEGLVEWFKDNEFKPFEVGVVDGKVVKCAVRTNCNKNENTDVSLVFGDGIVITAWLNSTFDKHFTLDDSNYKKQ